MTDLTNGRYSPNWFRFIRQVVIFVLGIAILLYAVISSGHDIPFLLTGLALIGVIPIEDVLYHWMHRADKKSQLQDKRESGPTEV